jgi:MarR family transcriptional regulator, organic hydroperoxide resistance regulator
MDQFEDFYELVFENLKRIAFPQEWLAIDISMSKQEVFTMMVADRLKEATMGQLSDQMNFPMSTATGIVDRLVKKGYIKRDKSESDRRIVVISLTEKGKAFIDDLKTNILAYIKKAYDILDEEEKKYLFKIFNKVSSSLQQFTAEVDQDKKDRARVRKIEIE